MPHSRVFALTLRLFSLLVQPLRVSRRQRTGSAPVSQYFYPQDTGACNFAVHTLLPDACCWLRSRLTRLAPKLVRLGACADASLDGATVQEATFRGRLLRGITHELPDGYQGAHARPRKHGNTPV